MARTRKKTGVNFESSLEKLAEIVRRLEDEQVPLEESLKLFAEGKKLARLCETEMQKAENKVRQLMEDSAGGISESSMDADDSDESSGDDEDDE